MKPTNLLTILGVQTKENVISNLLAYCFDNCESFRTAFLDSVCKIETSDPSLAWKAHTQVSTGKTGIPDLVLLGRKPGVSELVVVENKLKAEEGKDQTERYSSPKAIGRLKSKFRLNGDEVRAHFVFLTLFPDQKPSAKDRYVSSTYQDLAGAAKSLSCTDSLVNQLLSDWMSLLTPFYDRTRISERDIVNERLADPSGLDGGYLYFKEMINHLALPAALRAEKFFRDSKQGRRYYGAIISKLAWHPAPMKETDGEYHLDARRNFNVHFEPQYDVLNGNFSLFIHYEVFRYLTEEKAKARIRQRDYDAYLQRRDRFVRQLESREMPGLKMGGGSNQIAKASLDFTDLTYREIRDRVEPLMSEVAAHIDDVLDNMK